MIDRLQMILERLAADRNPSLDHQRRLGGGEHVPLDRIRGIGEFQIVDMFQVRQPARYPGAQPVEFGFLRGDLFL